jgi:hypothetical protein
MLRCRLVGHRPLYRSDGTAMRWTCARSCGFARAKRYETPAQASRYVAALKCEDRETFGRRSLLSLLPLKLLERARRAG